ncbi:MAG: TetR/AcrR family transcriptional regulator [Defluviitaleaceae bacterium]|nr:TetR/AcrR family transcriptional regulator [Defluviitaleaceae bacterium]
MEVRKIPRTKNPEETRQKILNASQKLFIEKGYDETTILDIVAELGGLTRGAFYHHFKTKEEVLNAILDKQLEQIHPFTNKNIKGENGLEKIKSSFSYWSENMNEDFKNIQRIAIKLLKNPKFLVEHIKENQIASKSIIPLLEEGMKDGSIKRNNPKLLAELIFMLVNFWLIPEVYPMTLEEFREKSKFIKETLDALGCPIFTEDTLQSLDNIIEIIFSD